jgi:hypothetical protein
MRNGRAEIGKTRGGSLDIKSAKLIGDPISGSHQGQRHVPRQQAGHMTCTRPRAAPKKTRVQTMIGRLQVGDLETPAMTGAVGGSGTP